MGNTFVISLSGPSFKIWFCTVSIPPIVSGVLLEMEDFWLHHSTPLSRPWMDRRFDATHGWHLHGIAKQRWRSTLVNSRSNLSMRLSRRPPNSNMWLKTRLFYQKLFGNRNRIHASRTNKGTHYMDKLSLRLMGLIRVWIKQKTRRTAGKSDFTDQVTNWW